MANRFEKIAKDIEKVAQDLERAISSKTARDLHDHGHGVPQKKQREEAYEQLKRVSEVEWDEDAHVVNASKTATKHDHYDHGHGVPAAEQNKEAQEEWHHLAPDVEKVFSEEEKRYSAGGKMNQSTNALYYGDKNPFLHKKAAMRRAAALQQEIENIQKIAHYLEERGL